MKDSREREEELLKKISETVRDASTDEENIPEPGNSYFIVGGDIFNITNNYDRGSVVHETSEVSWGPLTKPKVRKPEAPLTEAQRYGTRRWIYAKCASLGNQSLFVDYCEFHFGTAMLSQLSDEELLDLEQWLTRQCD